MRSAEDAARKGDRSDAPPLLRRGEKGACAEAEAALAAAPAGVKAAPGHSERCAENLRKDPRLSDALRCKAIAAFWLGDLRLAGSLLKDAICTRPASSTNYDAYYFLGLPALAAAGNVEKARTLFSRAAQHVDLVGLHRQRFDELPDVFSTGFRDDVLKLAEDCSRQGQ